MKLKFKIKKNNQVTHENVVDTMEAGDAWVVANAASFGLPDRSFASDQLVENGLTIQQATSTSQDPLLDIQGNPMLDANNQPIIRTMYHFSKDWSVEISDITAQEVNEEKVQDRTRARDFCLSIVDEIAVINKDLNNPTLMTTIFSNANFQSIILALLTGATATARALVVAHGPSLYPQATVNSLVAKLDAYIASEI